MNSYFSSTVRCLLLCGAAIGLLAADPISGHAQGISFEFTANNYTVVQGGSVSGWIGMYSENDSYDAWYETDGNGWEWTYYGNLTDWYVHSEYDAPAEVYYSGTGNYQEVDWNAGNYGDESFYFQVPNSGTPGPDTTAELTVYEYDPYDYPYDSNVDDNPYWYWCYDEGYSAYWDYPDSATVTVLNPNTTMGVVVNGPSTLTESETQEGTYLRIYRSDNYNNRTVYYTVGGDAVNGDDYTASFSGSVTFTAGGSLYVDIPIATLNNIPFSKTLTLTITSDALGSYDGVGNYATIIFSPYVADDSDDEDYSDDADDDSAQTFQTVTAPFNGINISNQKNGLGAGSASNIVANLPFAFMNVQAVSPYATSQTPGVFEITRSGGTNAFTLNYTIAGTAIAGGNYMTLPASVQLATNQTSTNLLLNVLTNLPLTSAQTVVMTLTTSSNYFLGYSAQAVVTLLPNSSLTNSVASPAGRYWRGSGSDPTYWSQVIPLDYETGTIYSNMNGNCSTLYSNLSSWSSQTLYHYNAAKSLPQTNIANRIVFNNPIVAFGERTGGTPLYISQPYNYGIYAGDPLLTATQIVIQVYNRSNDQLAGSINVVPPNYFNTNSMVNYVTNGFQVTTNAFGLTTTLSDSPSLNWGATSLGAYVLTHTASTLATNYYYLVEVSGYPAAGSNAMAITAAGTIAPSLLYTMEFEARPPWRSIFLNQPQFTGTPMPPIYAGKSLAEMLTNTPPVTNVVNFVPSAATTLDDSPELRRHPTLDNFVASMGNDPIALANYVINSIDLTDPMDYSDSGNIAEQAINPGGVSRGALGTFMEKQGSAVDQCALLIYLLRQAGVPAVYEFAPRNGLQILDARLSQMLKFQVQGAVSEAGQLYTTNSMIAVNYPWVAAYIGTNWVHIFPWLKDYEITEGFNLYDYMPTNYSSAYPWVRDYIYGNSNLLSLATNGDNTPSVIFPAYLQQTLLQNYPGVSVDDIGVQILNRQHYYSRWQDFPTPTWVTNVSTPLESLTANGITNISPTLTNIFDTVSVEIYSVSNPTNDFQTGNLRLVDLHNREFYINQTVNTNNTNQVQLSLILLPFRTNITSQMAFTNDPGLLSREVLSMTLGTNENQLGVRFVYLRHQALSSAHAIDPSIAFLGYNASEEINLERPLWKGDQAAICMDYGRVTQDMLNVHAADIWRMENALQLNPSLTNSVSPDVYEGAVMNLAGMSYYKEVSDFNGVNENLNKVNTLSSWAVGLSKISAARDSFGNLTNGLDPVLPNVDMFFYEAAYVGNGTVQPDSGAPFELAQQNFNLLSIINNSAEEHQTINRFYQQTNAVSTVRLLQLSQSSGAGIVPLNFNNYIAQGQTLYQNQALQNWDPAMWSQIVSALQNSPYTIAYITPGPIGNGTYTGMAALILGWNQWQALISPRSLNGAFGQYLLDGTISPDLALNPDGTLDTNPNSVDTAFAPDSVLGIEFQDLITQIQNGQFAISSQNTLFVSQISQVNNLSMSGTPDQNTALAVQNAGLNGLLIPNYPSVSVADPVRPLTGEFSIDETDLQLPGPMPLSLRRNYSSQNLADNQFGVGWKLSIMPYLAVASGGTNIYAADMDGAVLAYIRTNASMNVWIPTLAANPQLNNKTAAGVGGLVNRLRDRIVQTVNGSTTNYTLYGADGSTRVYQVVAFNDSSFTQTRPYLQTWTDSLGNYYTFTYGTDPTQPTFGQVTRIQSSNGNYLGFDYDVNGHIIDANSGDGRWLHYDYDEYGDLITVTLPDDTTHSYQYLHSSQIITNNTVVYLPSVTRIAAGGYQSAFLKNDGSLWNMGENEDGEMGNGTYSTVTPPEMLLSSDVTAIACGWAYTLFLKSDGSLWAMGYNADGELGDGSFNNKNLPEQIVSSNVTAIAAEDTHSLFLKSDGSLWAMGDNQYCALGDTNSAVLNTNRPEQIVSSNVTAIAAGGNFSLFLKSDGSLWGMGRGDLGQLGAGNYNPTNNPVKIVSGNVTAIAAGLDHSLFIKSDGSLWGMGFNAYGQLGTGSNLPEYYDTPVEILTGGVKAISGGELSSLFIETNGSLWAMGWNYYGQLGVGSEGNQFNSPTLVVSSNVTAIAAGGLHSLFIKSDGSLWSMGYNYAGQLGDGTYNTVDLPEQITAVSNDIVTVSLPITYSTHLIIEEDKPDGRVLQNAYDSQRRVTNQLSTAGTSLTLVPTATFIYANNFIFTNSYTNTISGYTLIIDGNNHTNRYDYTNSLITKITDPLGQTILQTWYPDTTNAPGYPRSLLQLVDKRGMTNRFQYDSNGNVTNTITFGDLTGNGITTQTATNTAVYNTNSLPVQLTDPAGNSTVIVYDPVFNFLPQQTIRYAGTTPVSTNFTFYGDATNVVINGSVTQTNVAFGLPIRQIRAYGSPDAATNDLAYDGHGFVTQSIRYTGTGDPNIVNTFYYNERGQMVNQVDALGAVTFFDYDALNRQTEQEQFDEFGNALSWNFDYYNDNGELNWVDGPRYNPEDYVYYDYDGAGRRITEIHWRSEANSNGSGVEAPAGYNQYAQSFYQYDPLGNLTLAVDPRGAMTTNTWDALCRLVQRTHLDTNGVTVLSVEGFGYEPGGQVKYYTNALGGLTTNLYTITGKPELRGNADGSTNAWRYYLDGRIYQEIQGNGAYWQTTYDDVNRITTRIFYSAAGVPEATNSIQLDRRGNVIQKVDAGGNVFTTTYDGLDRTKTAVGPPAQGNTAQQTAAIFYDAVGRAMTNVNALGEKTVSKFDAIGRPVSTQIYSASSALVHETYFAYSPDHNSVTVTSGSGSSAIVNTTWTAPDGHTLLSIVHPSANAAEFTLNRYDLAGNLVSAQHDSSVSGTITTWTTTTLSYDGLNRPTSKYDRDNARTTYAYDPMGDLTNRTMPGGLQWQAAYNSAGQILMERTAGTSSAYTKTNVYSYFPGGSPFAGLLKSNIDGRAVSCTHTYDDFLRVTTNTYRGALAEQNVSTVFKYDARGFATNIAEQFASGGTGPATTSRSFDPYGQLASESITVGGAVFSSASQGWNAAGRRTAANFGSFGYNFGWQADGNLVSASNSAGSGTYSYDTAGILTGRLVGGRSTSITSRDGEGRPLSIATADNGTQLTESLSWGGDGLLNSDTLARADFTDSRAYSYANQSRRLIQEQLNLNASTQWTNALAYDNGASAGLGVLTQMGQSTGTSNKWSGVVDAFSRISLETNSTLQYPAYGHVNGQATLSAWLDNQPVSVTVSGTNAMQWRAMMELTPGQHQLKAGALHPSGLYTAWATNSFTNNLAYQTTVDAYDAAGEITNRVWRNPNGTTNRTQALQWDARGRLYKVTDRSTNNFGYNWTATYDGLNRRLQTTTVLVTNGVAITSSSNVISQYYDPQVEFLELGVAYNNQTEWKLYGPDLNGRYGGLNGTGGFDASSSGSQFNPTISDARGNILAVVVNGVVSWNSSRPTGYGAVPNYRPVALGNGANVAQSSAWRGRWVDITGYYQIGLRPYDPVSGRWLTYDSVWNERDPNYYSFAGGEPIMGFDSDGRFSNDFYYQGNQPGQPILFSSATGDNSLNDALVSDNYDHGIGAALADGERFHESRQWDAVFNSPPGSVPLPEWTQADTEDLANNVLMLATSFAGLADIALEPVALDTEFGSLLQNESRLTYDTGVATTTTASTGAGQAVIINVSAANATTLRLPASMINELPYYRQAAAQGLLVRTRTADLPYSNYRATWEAANGPVPDGFDVDHIIQRQHGGSDELYNLQLKPSGLNRSEGSQARWLQNQFPYGTLFDNVELAPQR
jgi:RHS repeat-associated protein